MRPQIHSVARRPFGRCVGLTLGLLVVALVLALGSVAQAHIILGTGTGSLIGGDLTDPEDDGLADSDVNYNATFTSTDEPGFGGGEFSFNVFDNRVGGGNDKWCCNDPGAGGHQLTAQFHAGPKVLRTFTITSSNDSPGRDPSIWEIQGSNDGVNFTPIYSHSAGSVWTARNQVVAFMGEGDDFATPPAYEYIRYDVQDTVSGGHALNELEYFDTLYVPPPPPPPAFSTRMIRIVGGGGSNDNDINNTSEALSIAQAATGTGTLTIGSKIYNVGTFVDQSPNPPFIDYAGGGGSFGYNSPYPDGTTGGEDFLVLAQALLTIPAGTWTIAFGSDDGGLLRVNDIAFTSRFGSGGEAGPDEVRYEGTRGHGWTGGTFTVSDPWTYTELYSLFFERGGGDSYEIALAQGAQGGFNSSFELLYDGLHDWHVHPIPEPGTCLLLGGGLLALLRRRRRA